MKIVLLVERDGKKRSFHVASVTAKTVRPILKVELSEGLPHDGRGLHLLQGRVRSQSMVLCATTPRSALAVM